MTEEDFRSYRAYIEGRNAARDGLSKEDCPYLDGSFYLIDSWERGFEESWSEIFEGCNV